MPTLLRLKLVALLTVQDRVEYCPWLKLKGLAVKTLILGREIGVGVGVELGVTVGTGVGVGVGVVTGVGEGVVVTVGGVTPLYIVMLAVYFWPFVSVALRLKV